MRFSQQQQCCWCRPGFRALCLCSAAEAICKRRSLDYESVGFAESLCRQFRCGVPLVRLARWFDFSAPECGRRESTISLFHLLGNLTTMVFERAEVEPRIDKTRCTLRMTD